MREAADTSEFRCGIAFFTWLRSLLFGLGREDFGTVVLGPHQRWVEQQPSRWGRATNFDESLLKRLAVVGCYLSILFFHLKLGGLLNSRYCLLFLLVPVLLGP